VLLLQAEFATQEVLMRFRVYFSDVQSPSGQKLDMSKVLSVAFDTRESAIERACEYIKRGATILRIAGPQGFVMSQVDIKNEYQLKTQMNKEII
jgi:hypothetical protein